jgi:PIN domain nuclease of toxin-antitoxin system
MRYYIDTNVLIFHLSKNHDDISSKVADLLSDCANTIYVSSIAVQELLLLYRIEKIKHLRFKSEADILDKIKKADFEIVFFNKYHFAKYAELEIVAGHKDMNDHAIISQAMCEKIALISSDREFANYAAQGLDFVFNKR